MVAWFWNFWQTASPWSLLMWGLISYVVVLACFVVAWGFFCLKDDDRW